MGSQGYLISFVAITNGDFLINLQGALQSFTIEKNNNKIKGRGLVMQIKLSYFNGMAETKTKLSVTTKATHVSGIN